MGRYELAGEVCNEADNRQGKGTGFLDFTENVKLFENSIRLCWIEHIENKHPQLRAVTSLKMKEWEEQLQAGIVSKQS